LSFETTQWSVVLAAGGEDSRAARTALGALCEAYWYPLYAYVRRWGARPDEARDLTQGFLTSLLERRDFKGLSQERGRFRAFLLASLRHFLAKDAAKRRSQKRGGGAATVPLQSEDAEHRYLVEPVDSATPERLYERRWALTVIDRVLVGLRREAETEGRTATTEPRRRLSTRRRLQLKLDVARHQRFASTSLRCTGSEARATSDQHRFTQSETLCLLAGPSSSTSRSGYRRAAGGMKSRPAGDRPVCEAST